MVEDKVYIGIDISQEQLDMAAYPGDKVWKYGNNKHGITKVVEKLLAIQPKLIVMEATGGLELALRQALEQAGLAVAVMNPRRTRDFGRAMGFLAKTDKLDAKGMALFAAKIEPPVRPLQSASLQGLEHLLNRREQLNEMLTVEKNRLKQARELTIQKQIQEHIAWMERQIEDLDRRTKERVQAELPLKQKVALLKSMNGVGDILSANLVVKLPELGQLNQREIAALVGLAPFNRDSGKYRGKRMIWGGRAQVRKAFYMPVLSAIRANQVIGDLYHRLIQKGKLPKVAVVACMHKMLTILNAMVKNNTPWDVAYNRARD